MSEQTKDYNALSDDDFRQQFRTFLAAHFPPELRKSFSRPFFRLRGETEEAWLKTLYQHGWRAPAWPREYGGMGLTFAKQLIYYEELEHANVARVAAMGETMFGPTLMHFGSEAQKKYYLPRILSCEHGWAQGYSEPGSGSDLASLRTQAVREGDFFIVNGQKIWTTMANNRTHCFALVRTGKYAKKQQGISFLIIDLKSPGVTIRTIPNLAGEDELCEVFFDNVRVPAENLVGELDKGWTVAKALLGHERLWIVLPAMFTKLFDTTVKLLAETGLNKDPAVMERYAVLAADFHDFQLLYAEMCQKVIEEDAHGAEISVLKIYMSELAQRLTDFNLEVGQEYAGIVGEFEIGETMFDLHWPFMVTRPMSIFGGTNEVQRDILARAVLDMPAEPVARSA